MRKEIEKMKQKKWIDIYWQNKWVMYMLLFEKYSLIDSHNVANATEIQ